MPPDSDLAADTPASRLPALGPNGEGWVVGQFVLVGAVAVIGFGGLGGLPPSTPAGWVEASAGVVALVAGLAVGGLGARQLGHSLTAMPRPGPRTELVEAGEYRSVRHPIYAGVILTGVGWAFATTSLPAVVAALALAAWLDLKSRREEVWLLERFGNRYAAYRARTHRFIPGLY